MLSQTIINIKKRWIGNLLTHCCVDNNTMLKRHHTSSHVFEPATSGTLQRDAITSVNRIKLEKSHTSAFSDSFVTCFKNTRIDAPYGFAYTDEDKLICPPNWPMSMLVNGFPIKNHLKPAQSVDRINITKGFYLVGPGVGNYYHWITDKISTLPEYLKYKAHYDPECKLIFPKTIPKAFIEMLAYFGVDDSDLIKVDHSRDFFHIDELIVAGSNKSRSHHAINQPGRLNYVRDHLIKVLEKQPNTQNNQTPNKIFISRRDAGAGRQRVDNHDAVEEYLNAQGFVSITLSGKTLEEQATLFHSADHIVALHGAALTNLIFCQPNTKILEILPTSHMARYYRDIADILDLHHEFIAVKPDRQGHYNLNITQLEGLL